MFVTANPDLGFIHIPRTGGTSVTRSLENSDCNITQVCRTHALYKEFSNHMPVQWFATVRHPAARLHSGYYYQIEQDKNRLAGNLPMKSGLTKDFLHNRIDMFCTYGFEKTILSPEFCKDYNYLKQKYNIKSLNVLEQMQSICEYINGCKNIILFDIDTQSTELFDWIKNFIPSAAYVCVNNKNQAATWKEEMSDKLRDYINNKYKDDLKRFEYTL